MQSFRAGERFHVMHSCYATGTDFFRFSIQRTRMIHDRHHVFPRYSTWLVRSVIIDNCISFSGPLFWKFLYPSQRNSLEFHFITPGHIYSLLLQDLCLLVSYSVQKRRTQHGILWNTNACTPFTTCLIIIIQVPLWTLQIAVYVREKRERRVITSRPTLTRSPFGFRLHTFTFLPLVRQRVTIRIILS